MKILRWSFLILSFALSSCAEEEVTTSAPVAAIDLLQVQSFALAEAFTYDWSKERPRVDTGTLLVIKVDPKLVQPTDTLERVLYVGNQTAQRLNQGHRSGHVIAIVPGEIDLTQAPIWLGRPNLPERVDTQTVKAERALADRSKIKPFGSRKIESVTKDPLEASDLAELLREHASELVMKYAPEEESLAATWRLPVAQ